jgi:glycosyltransferase involved in cell wall biosynthesis
MLAQAPLGAPAEAGSLRAFHLCTRYLRGGSERRIADLISALPEVEHHVMVGGESDPALARSVLAPATVTEEPALVRQPDPARDLLTLTRVTRRLRDERFDVVFTHQSKAGVIGRLSARLAGAVPVVHSLSMASFGPGYRPAEDRLFRSVERRLARHTAAFSVVGHDLAARYAELGVPAEKFHVVRSGAPLPSVTTTMSEARAALAHRFDVPPERPLMSYIGSLEARKNVLALPAYLDAVAAAMHRRPFLLVAGEGPLRRELEDAFVAGGQADDVRVVGYVRPIDDVVIGADVTVLLSRAEGLPQVLLQSAYAGTPFVAYDVDGVRELLELGARGGVVPLGAVEEAAAATVPFLTVPVQRQPSEEQRAAFGSWDPSAIAVANRRMLASILETDPASARTAARRADP